MLEPGLLGGTHPHRQISDLGQIALKNQQYILGMNWESLTTLQTENRTR